VTPPVVSGFSLSLTVVITCLYHKKHWVPFFVFQATLDPQTILIFFNKLNQVANQHSNQTHSNSICEQHHGLVEGS